MSHVRMHEANRPWAVRVVLMHCASNPRYRSATLKDEASKLGYWTFELY